MRRINPLIITVLILSIMFSLIGCNNKATEGVNEIESDNVEYTEQEEKQNKDGEEVNNKEEKEEDDEKQEIVKEEKGIPSPLSGTYGPKEKVNRRPVAVMFDNHPKARWQAGLSQAEIVYEFLVEYPYTRYMGIFLLNDPDHIGPIRSTRPYFITALLEYDPIYVRVGGSEAAKADVRRLKIADIDGLSSSSKVFWRYYKTGKTRPNNMYSSLEVIREEQRRRGYRLKGNYEGFKFNKEDKNIDGNSANTVIIKYNKSNTTKYVYDEEKKVYKRYKDGKLHIDELDKTAIKAKNIIIQRAKTEVIDNVGRLSIDLVGKGRGYYITNGKAIRITWEKSSRNGKTRFYDSSNKEIKLNSGVTWIQVTKLSTDITIE
ncbi:DUF3048 domain-containing protein [Caldisalinibacter kiritimatiensis]|uniref:Lipoprotein yerB n=1 Tax=Caldisalinibacter kiritimatiensis TaxID=1304284 RepID=R1CZ72_9FIRM|nr:DUF3048 domain-containing protein [Caldisalinibacter kiritimatiensis]EOD01874.1 hypothetical protein L21TH_0035 [Caldisalinibacter kiritimatiensis]